MAHILKTIVATGSKLGVTRVFHVIGAAAPELRQDVLCESFPKPMATPLATEAIGKTHCHAFWPINT